ncbi:hypothetical protein ACFWP7_41610 [Streptomyces sp. NPDC058470]
MVGRCALAYVAPPASEAQALHLGWTGDTGGGTSSSSAAANSRRWSAR